MKKLIIYVLLLAFGKTFAQDTKVTITGGAIGGGSGNNIYNIDSSLSSDRTVDLNGKQLLFNESSNSLLRIDPVNHESKLNAVDGTAFSYLDLVAIDGGDRYFNLNTHQGGVNVEITGDATTNTINYTGATQTIIAPTLFHVTDGVVQLVSVDVSNRVSFMRATDGTADAILNLGGDSNGIPYFSLDATDGTNQVDITGSPGANTLTYTAATHTFTAPTLFLVTDGTNDLLSLDRVNKTSLLKSYDVSTTDVQLMFQDAFNHQTTISSATDAQLSSITIGSDSLAFNNNVVIRSEDGTGNYSQIQTWANAGISAYSKQLISLTTDNTTQQFQSALTLGDSSASLSATTTSSTPRIYNFSVSSHFARLYANAGPGGASDTATKFLIHTDSLATINSNNIAYFDLDTLKRGHIAAPTFVAGTDLTAQSAAVSSIATYTPTANGTYRIGGYVNVTAIVTNVITLKVTYTDINSNSVTQIIPLTLAATGAIGTTATIVGNNSATDIQIRAKSGSAITVLTTATGVGSETYDVGATIEKLR